MSDKLKFRCDSCGKEFDADPDCMVEVEILACTEPEPGEEWKTPEPHPHPILLSAEDRERAKKEHGWTDEQLDRALSGEPVESGACICKECQDKALDEAEA